MPATYTAQHLNSRVESRMVDYDIDAALNVVDLGLPQGASKKCLPISGYKRFRAGLFRSVVSGGVTAFQIIAATAADGTGATIVVAHALGAAPDALNDQVWLECDAEQIREVLATATHVGVRVQLAQATDEAVVFFERAEPFYVTPDLTADYVA